MPKNSEQNAEPNSEMIRIRCTPTMKKAFMDYCDRNNISEASVGRLGIWNEIRRDHKKATGKELETPDTNTQNWGRKAG